MRHAMAIASLMVAVSAGCVTEGLSASSTCEEFLKAGQEDRARVIAEMYEDQHGPSTMGAAMAVANAEYVCDGSPGKQLSEITLG